MGGGDDNVDLLSDLWAFDISDESATRWQWAKLLGGEDGLSETTTVQGEYRDFGDGVHYGSRKEATMVRVSSTEVVLAFGYVGQIGAARTSSLFEIEVSSLSSVQVKYLRGSVSTEAAGVYGTTGTYDNLNEVNRVKLTNINCLTETGTGETWECESLITFGGSQPSSLRGQDVMEYNISSNQWRHLRGPKGTSTDLVMVERDVYGDTDLPGDRFGHFSAAFPSTGIFVIFGGYGSDSTGDGGEICDTWLFDSSTSQWKFVNGNLTRADCVEDFGTRDVYSASTLPSARYKAASWQYGTTLIIFGSHAYESNLWQFETDETSDNFGMWR